MPSTFAINGSNTFYMLNVTNAQGSNVTLTIQAGSTQTIGAGGFNYSTITNKNLQLRSSTGGTQWKISPSAAETVGSYVDVKDSNNIGGYALDSGSNYVNSGNNTNWSFP
jgi:hypothetical protein